MHLMTSYPGPNFLTRPRSRIRPFIDEFMNRWPIGDDGWTKLRARYFVIGGNVQIGCSTTGLEKRERVERVQEENKTSAMETGRAVITAWQDQNTLIIARMQFHSFPMAKNFFITDVKLSTTSIYLYHICSRSNLTPVHDVQGDSDDDANEANGTRDNQSHFNWKQRKENYEIGNHEQGTTRGDFQRVTSPVPSVRGMYEVAGRFWPWELVFEWGRAGRRSLLPD